MCPVCRGRGEVEAGVSTGAIESAPYYPDHKGRLVGRSEPTGIVKNPTALINGEVWLLENNSFGPLWGIAVCGRCRGSGLRPEKIVIKEK